MWIVKKKKPIIFRNNNVSGFDVDGTLISKGRKRLFEGAIELRYGDETLYYKPNEEHIRYLKHCSNSGDLIIVWSKNRFQWAEQVVKVLKLEPYVDIVMCKLARHIDDKQTFEEIVGNRIFFGGE